MTKEIWVSEGSGAVSNNVPFDVNISTKEIHISSHFYPDINQCHIKVGIQEAILLRNALNKFLLKYGL